MGRPKLAGHAFPEVKWYVVQQSRKTRAGILK